MRGRLTDAYVPGGSPRLDAKRGPAGPALRRVGLRRPPACREPSPKAVSNAELDRWLVSVGLRKVKSTTLGFAHFTFFGRNLFTSAASVRLHCALQMLADRNVPVLRQLGNQHIVLAQKISNGCLK